MPRTMVPPLTGGGLEEIKITMMIITIITIISRWGIGKGKPVEFTSNNNNSNNDDDNNNNKTISAERESL